MGITARHLADLHRDGFVALPGFLPEADARAAREGSYTQVAPPYARRDEPAANRPWFPWDDDGLNAIAAHPALIAAAERIMGTREVQLLTGFVWTKHSGVDYGGSFHIDHANNTLAPEPARDDFMHLSFLVYLDEVDAALAPILMVPNGRPDEAALPIMGPAGTVCVYSIETRHSASRFTRDGHRIAMWVNVGRKDRPWDHAIRFRAYEDHELRGMARFIATASPRQLEFIGFPPVGHPLWAPAYLAGMARRYPGFDPARYGALASSAGL